MPLYTVTMKNGNTFQLRARDKDEARRIARRRAQIEETGLSDPDASATPGTTPSSVKVNK